jgi:phage baseplate assembly protein W
MALDFPFRVDSRGRSAEVFADAHIRDLIEQVLFTVPGERVNRPDFGCGLLQLAFAPNSDALAAAVQTTVQGSLQQWLGELIEVEAVDIEHPDALLKVSVQYIVRRDRDRQLATFTRGLG